jgi:hypothetical protein
MSVNREDFGVEYVVFAGTTKTLEAIIIDPDTGNNKDLSNTSVYATGVAKVYKPDGTAVGSNMTISYGDAADRTAGLVTFTVLASSQSTNANAGNWIGEIELSNVSPLVVEQQKFNIKIIESY